MPNILTHAENCIQTERLYTTAFTFVERLWNCSASLAEKERCFLTMRGLAREKGEMKWLKLAAETLNDRGLKDVDWIRKEVAYVVAPQPSAPLPPCLSLPQASLVTTSISARIYRDCLQSGHKRWDPACGAFPDPPLHEADSVAGDLEGRSLECQDNDRPSFNKEESEDFLKTLRLMWSQRLSFCLLLRSLT
ncbi:hypothetical protein ACOMHN_023303 [Nucella lapillus]